MNSLWTQSLLLAETASSTGGGGNWLGVLIAHLLAAIAFSVVGIVVLSTSFWIIKRQLPFSITKEIEEDQNTALAIIIAAVILGLSIIIAAAIVG